MDGARKHVPQFANLPPYTGPGLPTRARNIVKALTEVPDYAVETIDDNVKAALPKGSRVVGFSKHGAAYWTRTAAIRTIQEDGSKMDFFLKVTHTDVGRDNLRGEYESMKAIYNIMPEFVPEPICQGVYASDPDINFFLMRFVDMTDEVPEVDSLPEKVAEMHRKGVSPTGKYGFNVPTNEGALQQPNTWTESWEKFFSELLTRCFEWEREMHGENEEMEALFKKMIDKVVPRLLRPLETGDNEIQPRLVHGDLWDGNTTTDAITEKPLIFDASSMYAHNEFELGAWNLPRHQIFRTYIREYQRHFERSEPKEDFEDRLILYRHRFDLTSSACYLNNLRFRELAIVDMRYLTEKYANGYKGQYSQKGT